MRKSYFYAGISIFCWSTLATNCKFLLRDLTNMQLLWMDSLIAGVFLLILNIFNGNFLKFKNYKFKDYLIMAAIGIPGTLLYYIFYYAGADILPASQAFIINYMWPIMSVLFACIILGEKLTIKKIMAIFISFLGVVVIVGGDIRSFDKTMLLGALYCILAAVSYGLFTALNQKMNYNKVMSLMVSYIITFIVTTLINSINGDMFIPECNQLFGFVWNGVFTAAIANTLWVIALEKGKTEKISNLAYITPFLSLVWTSLLLNETIGLSSVIGLFIIIFGIFIQIKDKTRNKSGH